MPRVSKTSDNSTPRRSPARTLEARERELSSLATDCAEQQMRKGTASAQVIVHYLRLATTEKELELEQMRLRNELLKAQADNLRSQAASEELYAKALSAMRAYSGNPEPKNEFDD